MNQQQTIDPSPLVLVIGADPVSMAEVGPQPEGRTTEDVIAVIERQHTEISAMSSSTITSLISHDGSSSPDLTEALDSRSWDYIVVGAGIHRRPAFLQAFEDIMNQLHRHPLQHDAYLAFAQSVDEVTEAAERALKSHGVTA